MRRMRYSIVVNGRAGLGWRVCGANFSFTFSSRQYTDDGIKVHLWKGISRDGVDILSGGVLSSSEVEVSVCMYLNIVCVSTHVQHHFAGHCLDALV